MVKSNKAQFLISLSGLKDSIIKYIMPFLTDAAVDLLCNCVNSVIRNKLDFSNRKMKGIAAKLYKNRKDMRYLSKRSNPILRKRAILQKVYIKGLLKVLKPSLLKL